VPITTNDESLNPTPVSSTNKTDHHDITEILLKVVLNTITLTLDEKIDRNSKIITKTTMTVPFFSIIFIKFEE
jgi:hypothetical protein